VFNDESYNPIHPPPTATQTHKQSCTGLHIHEVRSIMTKYDTYEVTLAFFNCSSCVFWYSNIYYFCYSI